MENHSVMYKLPWSKEDNPNGWIEPTTACQLKCPGCYRGVDQEDHKQVHRELEELKKEVDWMIQNRNIQTLSVAGGEPLLYPELQELIKYASMSGLRIMLYTNGLGLNAEKLIKLRESGITTILVHIDRFQGRTKTETLDEILDLRRGYCELFREVGGVNLGFIQPLSHPCLDDLNKVQDFFNRNRDIISLIVYTLYREICWDHDKKPLIDTTINISEVIESLEETETFIPASHLPTTSGKEPAWVFSYSLGSSNRIAGFLDSGAYEFIQKRYYKKSGRFLFISRKNTIDIAGLMTVAWFSSIFKIIIKLLFRGSLFKKKYLQTILVIRGPVFDGSGWDLCSGCPDAMIYNDRLVPSCILEDIRKKHTNPEVK